MCLGPPCLVGEAGALTVDDHRHRTTRDSVGEVAVSKSGLVVRAHVIVPQVGHQHAEGGEVTGHAGHDQRRDVQFARDFGRVQPAGAAESEEGEVARIVAARNRDAAHRERHLRDRDLDDAERGFIDGDAERLGDLLADALARCLHVERHLAAEKTFGDHASERDVGIGDGRFRAALTVGDRTGMTAGAARADFQRADLIDPGDAAAAGADLDDVDDRQHHRMSARDAADEVALRDIGFAILHQAGLWRSCRRCRTRSRWDNRGRLPTSAAAMIPPTGPRFHHCDRNAPRLRATWCRRSTA